MSPPRPPPPPPPPPLPLTSQFLQLRFVLEKATGNTSGVLHLGFAYVDQRITFYLSKGPGVLMTSYGFLKSMLARQVALPEPGAKPKMCVVS